MGGFAGGFALIVVLFILLIVAGAGGFATPGY
ncbi:YjcZ family sporulation protein [Mesobacillus harenae]|nr:YjcZ family sporulation protein [Mesobacillus harenae]